MHLSILISIMSISDNVGVDDIDIDNVHLSISEQEACVKQFFLEDCINSLICPSRLEGAQYVVRKLDGTFPETSAGLQKDSR